MKAIYQCDWCGKRDTEEEIRTHEPTCIYNKELRSCLTCKNKKGLTEIICSTGKEVEKGKYFQFCPIWEDDGRDWTKPVDSKNNFGDLFGGLL